MNSLTGVKRARSDGEVVSVYGASPFCHASPPLQQRMFKRARRLSEPRAPQLLALLRSDRDAARRFSARTAFLSAFNAPDSQLLGMLPLLGGDASALLSIIDLNSFQHNIVSLIDHYNARAVSMTTLNVRGHSFCVADKHMVLTSFSSAYGHHRVACALVHYVAHTLFRAQRSMSINILSGGGVRDVLIAEWCNMYKLKTRLTPPQLIFVRCESRLFLIPIVV